MISNSIDAKKSYSLLGRVEGAEKALLSGRRNREEDLESAVTIFLEFLRGFESFTLDQKCITVFGSARFKEDHPYYQLARDLGRELANAGYAVMTGGGPGIMEAANRGAKEAGGISLGCNIKRRWCINRLMALIPLTPIVSRQNCPYPNGNRHA